MEDVTAGMASMSTDDSAEVRDRREEIAAALEDYPKLQSYFANIVNPVPTDGDPIRLIGEAKTNPMVAKSLMVFNVMASTCESEIDRLNGLLRQAEEHRKTIEKALTMALSKTDRDEAIPIKHPEAFTGDSSDLAKRSEEFKHWLQRVRSIWIDYPHKLRSERQKLTYFLTVLGGSALRSISKRLEDVIRSPNDPEQWAWKTAEEVITELAKQYETFDEKTDALKKITDLKQEEEYADDDRFVAYFSNLATTLEWDDKTKVMQFELRLCGKLKKAIESRDDMPDDDDFDGWVKKCRKITNRQATAAALGKMGQGFKAKAPANSNNDANKKDGNKGDPMDLDAMKLAIARLPQEVLNYRYQSNLCLNCGNAGHFAKNCKKKANTGGSGRGRGENRGGGQANRGGFGNGGFSRGAGNAFYPGQQQQGTGFNNGFGYGFGGGYGNNNAVWPSNSNGFGNFSRGQQVGNAFGNGGRGSGYPNRGGRGGSQLRFADAPEYIPDQGYVIGEVEGDYEAHNGSHGNGCGDSQDQGNA